MNRSTKNILFAGGALALLGVGAYFLFKPASSTTTVASKAPPAPPNLGNVNDPNSTAYACNAAWKLLNVGHPNEAAYWQQKCAAGGGTVQAYS